MQTRITIHKAYKGREPMLIARCAVDWADALLAELERRKPKC